MALGARIKQVREGLRLDQAELCLRVPGLTQQALSNLETRDSRTSEFAIRIADALRVPVRWLLDGSGSAECSGEAWEIAAIYDALDADGRRVMRATAQALLPPDVGPVSGAGALPSVAPRPEPAPHPQTPGGSAHETPIAERRL